MELDALKLQHGLIISSLVKKRDRLFNKVEYINKEILRLQKMIADAENVLVRMEEEHYYNVYEESTENRIQRLPKPRHQVNSEEGVS